MTDQTSNGYSSAKTASLEYRFYFAVIFLFTLPWTLATCVLGLVRPESEECGKNFVSRAWRRAAIITPMIFSA